MHSEPLITIGAMFTSLKLAVTASLTVLAVGLGLDEVMTAAVVGAGAAITIAVGDVMGYILTRDKVTPMASPNLPIGTLVNEDNMASAGVVTERPE